jgi:agmatinase
MYPTVRGVREAFPERPLTLVHFSAHPKAEQPRHHPLSDRDPVYNLLTDGVIEGSHLIQVGLRGPKASPQQLAWLRQQGVRYHTMAEVESRSWSHVMERVLTEAKATGQAVYISMDASVFDPSEIAAAGRAVPNGLRVGQLTPLIRRLCAETEVAGFEILDLAPMMDFGYVSALNSTAMYNACLSGLALRKLGILEEDYRAPMALDHGQP